MTPLLSETPNGLAVMPAEQLRQVLALLATIAGNVAPKPNPPKYLTVRDAAVYCRVAVQTIYNNRRFIERMPGVRKLLFTREALDTWLARRPALRRKRR